MSFNSGIFFYLFPEEKLFFYLNGNYVELGDDNEYKVEWNDDKNATLYVSREIKIHYRNKIMVYDLSGELELNNFGKKINLKILPNRNF